MGIYMIFNKFENKYKLAIIEEPYGGSTFGDSEESWNKEQQGFCERGCYIGTQGIEKQVRNLEYQYFSGSSKKFLGIMAWLNYFLSIEKLSGRHTVFYQTSENKYSGFILNVFLHEIFLILESLFIFWQTTPICQVFWCFSFPKGAKKGTASSQRSSYEYKPS